MLEPSDSQEAYDFLKEAIAISEQWHLPVILRMTTRICHSKTVVTTTEETSDAPPIDFERNIPERVMIPAYARPAHRRLRQKLDDVAEWNETSPLNPIVHQDKELGIITSGVTYHHVREAAPDASVLKLAMTYPLPIERIKDFTRQVDKCMVIEEGDPYLVEALRAEGIEVDGKAMMYRFGELNVARVRKIIEGDETPEAAPPKGKPPQLCMGCPHRIVFGLLNKMGCIVGGDIGCYTLGVLPPFEAMDTCVCMGASIGVGLGLRHILPDDKARKVVSVIGDSTFVHSGITGLVEMMYNQPKTGHLVIILDNSTTAMTGLQEHPGTGRTLNHEPTHQLSLEGLSEAIGIKRVYVLDPRKEEDRIETLIEESLAVNEPTVMIVRQPCLLAAKKIKQYEQQKECMQNE